MVQSGPGGSQMKVSKVAAPLAARFQWRDSLGNTTTVFVRDDGRVYACNQHRLLVCLSNVGFMIRDVNGTAAEVAAVKAAARAGLAELRRVTRLDWVQL